MSRSIKLRGNARTRDRRMDRVIEFDERSRDYPLRRRARRRSYTWRCDKYLNQGEEGACVGFSIGHELAARPAPVKRIGPMFCRKKISWEDLEELLDDDGEAVFFVDRTAAR
ncbi:MAG: hypothetical protein QGH46_04280 [Gammaproteobacteria bacterium]|nr:hypothetical protein [Gammaproteobacteria bacterium]MDP7094543.1 hypothetical protein [Gammaproteobacteria bacterium]MDP7271181.1 hypothetical protein [Gammaproteobacteria bacterium]HJP04610.1 hypothetical protein [Gammaproteobacteria bacterium]